MQYKLLEMIYHLFSRILAYQRYYQILCQIGIITQSMMDTPVKRGKQEILIILWAK